MYIEQRHDHTIIVDEEKCLYRGVVGEYGGSRCWQGGFLDMHSAFEWARINAESIGIKGIPFWVEYDLKLEPVRIDGDTT